jgi:predicted secreted hydrolase
MRIGAVLLHGGVGRRHRGMSAVFKPVRTWRSTRTNTSYPVSMDVSTGALTWRLDPLMDDQELDSRQSTGAVYWEGAVRVSRGGPGLAVGRGYLELTGYADALRTGGQ